MRRGQPVGWDELMIVNPGPSGSGPYFLGEDGTLYQVQGLEQGDGRREPGRFLREGGELGRFFFGDDGTLYEVVR